MILTAEWDRFFLDQLTVALLTQTPLFMEPESSLPCSQGVCHLLSRNLRFPTVTTGNVNEMSQDPTIKKSGS
jgi:hypothetical protein